MKWSARRQASSPDGPVLSAAEVRTVLDLVDDPVVVLAPVFDPDGRIVDATFVDLNGAACVDLGVETAPIGDSVTAWFGQLDTLWAAAQQAWDTGAAEPYEIEVRRGRSPSERRVHVILTRRIGRHLVQVSPQRTAMILAEEERERFAALLEVLDDGGIVVEPVRDGATVVDGRIVHANRACARHFVVSAEQVSRSHGTTIADYQRGPSGPVILEVVARAADGESASVVIDNTAGDHPLLANAFVRFLAHPDTSGRVLLFIQDATLDVLSQRRAVMFEAFAAQVIDGLDAPAAIVRVVDGALTVERSNRGAGDATMPDAVRSAVREAVGSGHRVEVGRHTGDPVGGPWDGVVTVTPLTGDRAVVVASGSRDD